VETAVLPAEAIPLRATIIHEDEKTDKLTAEGPKEPGTSIFPDGSPDGLGRGSLRGHTEAGVAAAEFKSYKHSQREAYDGESAAFSQALETATPRLAARDRFTIYTNAQAAIRRMGTAPARGTPSRQGSTPQPSAGDGRGYDRTPLVASPRRGRRETTRRTNGRGWQRTS
jgi:hypothetical protein